MLVLGGRGRQRRGPGGWVGSGAGGREKEQCGRAHWLASVWRAGRNGRPSVVPPGPRAEMARKWRAQGYGTRGVGTGNGATAAAAGGDGTARPWLDAGRSTPVSLRALRHSSRDRKSTRLNSSH